MDDEILALQELNRNASLLLANYTGVFTQLSEESQAILLAIATKSQEGLDAITELLASGNVAQAENALKLNGKTIDEINTILQVVSAPVGSHSVSVPNYANNKANFRQCGTESITIITKKANSKILILLNGQIKNNASGSHSYFDMKCNTNWVSGRDGLYADHGMNNDEGNPLGVSFTYSPNVPAGTSLTFTYWLGDWGGGTMNLNTYSSSNVNSDADGQTTLMEVS